MNERQLSIGESTCSGAFSAKGAGSGGSALMCVNELSRLAMERCATARCAVELMGGLAVRYGQGLTLAHFRAQIQDLLEHIAHVKAQREYLQDTSTG
jgi:hypothetical protein